MSLAHRVLSAHRGAVIAAVLGASAPGVHAQQPGNDGQGRDHTLVVARTVQPRIAYRGIPVDDNPVRMQATTFPGQVFQQTLDASMERLVGDGELGQAGSVGIDAAAALHRALAGGPLGSGTPARLGGEASAVAPLGGGAVAGGAVSAATRGLGGLVQGSLIQGGLLASPLGGGK